MIKKILATEKKKFYVKTLDEDFHSQYGFIKAADLKDSKDGDILISNTGKEMKVFTPNFLDMYEKIKRQAQIIPLKDVGIIIANTGFSPEWTIVDAGAGSGALSCFLANLACKGKVFTYDVREDHAKIVRDNIEYFGLDNITCEVHDVYNGIPQKNVDLITLDLPEPWKATEHAKNALRIGGFIVSYSPCVPQMADFVNSLPQGLMHIKTVEISEKEWDVVGRKVRPKSASIGHSGFLTFVRRVS